MAGSISLSMSQQFDEYGKPLAGGLLYTIEAGTTSTPQNAYRDSALTIAHPNPITLDSAGRVPQFYLADGSIKIRLTDSAGVQQLVADNVLVVGPSSGSGGGGSVDATTVLATGDLKVKYGTGTLSGFVRANGRTIGSATSGATERANADTQALFEYLWGADANLTVSGGRGASANADWTANKTLTLPDFRGRVIAGLDDMGNSAAGRLSASLSGVNGLTLGAAGGVQNQSISQSQLPNVTLTYSGSASVSSTVSNVVTGGVIAAVNGTGGVPIGALGSTGSSSGILSSTGTSSGSTSSINGGVTQSGLIMVQPTITATIYVKL
jgi:microcystin-dependent protein